MEVYLVRHGQTDGNVGHRHQHPNTDLNQKGIAQATAVAEQIAALKPTHLVTSTQVRALETARIVARVTGLIPESYPIFEELHQPAVLVGQRILSPHSAFTIIKWFFRIKSAVMHDGETYAQFVTRISEARQFLETYPKDARIVVVSHSIFINFFAEYMRNPKRVNVIRAAIRFLHIMALKNTSITHIRYEKPLRTQTGTGWHRVWGK
jgi:broad specificity phosphatase PhoE